MKLHFVKKSSKVLSSASNVKMKTLLGIAICSIFSASCSDAGNKDSTTNKTQNKAQLSNLNDSLKFDTTYEFESFLQPVTKLTSEQFCDQSGKFCATVLSPPAATHDLGQKKQRWVSQYSTGRITVQFKQDVNNFRIVGLSQTTSQKEQPVGVISEMYTPVKNDGTSETSCNNHSYKKGDSCVIGVTYKGLNFTATSGGDNIQDTAHFELKADNDSSVDAKMTIYNAHKSNGQNIGILSLENSDDPLNFSTSSSSFDKGLILLDDLLKGEYINSGDGVISLNKDTNHLVEMSLGLSNPSANLHDLYLYNNRYDNSFNCRIDKQNQVLPSSPCDMFGIVHDEPSTKDSYFSHFVFKYIAQPTGDGKNPIVIQSMIPVMFSHGDFIPGNYEVKRDLTIPDLSVHVRNVAGENVAYVPSVKNVHFYLKTDLGAFVPYSVVENKVNYNITNYDNFSLDYSVESGLFSLDEAPKYYKIKLVELLNRPNQPVQGGLLIASYVDGQNEKVNQVIGVVNVDTAEVIPKPPVIDIAKEIEKNFNDFCPSGSIIDDSYLNDDDANDPDAPFYFQYEKCNSGVNDGKYFYSYAVSGASVIFPNGAGIFPNKGMPGITAEYFRYVAYRSSAKFMTSSEIGSKLPYMKVYNNVYVDGLQFSLTGGSSKKYQCLLHLFVSGSDNNAAKVKDSWAAAKNHFAATLSCWDDATHKAVFWSKF